MPRVHINATLYSDDSFSGGATKQYYLDLIVKEIVNCLNANAISYNTGDLNPTDSVCIILKMECLKNPDENNGIEIQFTSGDPDSKRLSCILCDHMKQIYYDPSKVNICSEDENSGVDVPVVTIIFEDSVDLKGLDWVRQNIEEIAKQIIMALDEYFSLPYVPCEKMHVGMARHDESIRDKPSLNSEIVGCLESGKKIKVLGQWENWYIVGKNNDLGYIPTKCIEI